MGDLLIFAGSKDVKQYRGFITLFVVSTSIFILLQVWHVRAKPEEDRQNRERELKGVAVFMNMGAPRMLDDTTRLDAARYEDGVMRVSYTLPALAKDDIDLVEFTHEAKAASIAQSCANKATRPYMEAGLIIAHRFRDLNGEVISEFQVKGADCR